MSGGAGDRFADEDAQLVAREREQHMAMLRSIPDARREAAEREQAIVRYARMLGISWDDIAEAIEHQDNITVQEKYGEPEPGDSPF